MTGVIPSMDFGGRGERILFLHANGYPPACYRAFLEALASDYRPVAMLLRPLWPREAPEQVSSWKVFSDDVLRFAAQRDLAPIKAVGHSLGATVALRAALRAPDRFSALVLVDPVLFPPHVMLVWMLARAVGVAHRFQPMIRGALNRRVMFKSREQIFEAYRQRRLFRQVSDDNLRIYIEGITAPLPDGGFGLIYSPQWEARVYYTAGWNDWDLWRGIPALRVPTMIVRGEESDTFWKSTAHAVLARNPHIQVVTLPRASHLLPLEQPNELAQLTSQFLRESDLHARPGSAAATT